MVESSPTNHLYTVCGLFAKSPNLFVGHVQKLPKILRVVAIVPELFDEGNYMATYSKYNKDC